VYIIWYHVKYLCTCSTKTTSKVEIRSLPSRSIAMHRVFAELRNDLNCKIVGDFTGPTTRRYSSMPNVGAVQAASTGDALDIGLPLLPPRCRSRYIDRFTICWWLDANGYGQVAWPKWSRQITPVQSSVSKFRWLKRRRTLQ